MKKLTFYLKQLNGRLLGQQNLEDIIQTEMKKYNSSIELGVELVSLEQFDDRVEVKLHKHNTDNSRVEEESSKYEWVVGADGARGVVRKLIGLTFLGETKNEQFIVGDIKVEGLDDSDVGCPLFFLSLTTYPMAFRDGTCGVTWEILGKCCFRDRDSDCIEEYSQKRTSIRITEIPGLFNFIVGGSKLEHLDEITASEDAIRAFLREQTSNRADITFGEIVCYSPFRYVIYDLENLLELEDAMMQDQYSNG
jgi:hypothetical protein